MSTFEVSIVQIKIEDHPNADALELAAVGGFRAVVRKGRFKTGDWVAYAPEASLFPEWLLKQEGFWDVKRSKGMMAGSLGNRVKPIKLRGALSEGVIIKPALVSSKDPSMVCFAKFKDSFIENANNVEQQITNTDKSGLNMDYVDDHRWFLAGDNAQDFFGIEKYEPPIPIDMDGDVDSVFGWSLSFDIEHIKKYPNVLIPDEEVLITEKLHGTFCQMGYIPELDKFIVASKRLGAKGLTFKLNEKNKNNLYIKVASAGELSLLDKIKEMASRLNQPVYILGEIFGRGVQDLVYNMSIPTFRAFDMYVGKPQRGQYVDVSHFLANCERMNIPTVPILYRGPYSYEEMVKHTDGTETVSGGSSNIREGVVVKPIIDRQDSMIGRVALKNISEKYLTRIGKTTEFT